MVHGILHRLSILTPAEGQGHSKNGDGRGLLNTKLRPMADLGTGAERTPLYVFATSVVKTLSDAGHRAVFAGGCVRDMLLGHSPKDYDVATSARPDDAMKLFKRNVPVGVAFGVVRVLGPGKNPMCVEVATFR